MKDHEIILKMIEEVSVDDTDKLDEIDIKVFRHCGQGCYPAIPLPNSKFPPYTRSRDALKKIRPEGWIIRLYQTPVYNPRKPNNANLYHFNMDKYFFLESEEEYNQINVRAMHLPTEELAELHAIIQAIAHEREAQGE